MAKKLNDEKQYNKPIKVEYWPAAPIIVDGMMATKFYRASLLADNNTNKR